MTTGMIRKQIYLPKQLDDTLKQLSKKRGVSEAEIIRQALEHESTAGAGMYLNHQAAINAILRFSDERLRFAETAQPYIWNRDEIYDEREDGWDRK